MTCESANRATHSQTTKKEKLAAESLICEVSLEIYHGNDLQ